MARPRKRPSRTTPKSESQRVAAYRKRLMQASHYRNVSFLASPEEFSRIDLARERTGLSTKELMLAQLEQLEGNTLGSSAQEEYGAEDDVSLTELEAPQPEDPSIAQLKRGELFRLPGHQNWVLMTLYLNLERLPGLFPFDADVIRDFEHYREALQYYCLRHDRLPPAHQVLLLGRISPAEIPGLGVESDYRVRLRLNQIYPQIAEHSDGTDYRSVYNQMLAEYANEP